MQGFPSFKKLFILVGALILLMALAGTGMADQPGGDQAALERLLMTVGDGSGPAGVPVQSKSGFNQNLFSHNMQLQFSSPQTAFTNSDLAFWGNLAFVPNYGGFRIFDISSPSRPRLISNTPCRGPQNDVSVWENILILSVDAVMAGPNCGDAQLPSVPKPTSGWEGIRVFDVSDPANPQFLTSVYTDCGSHTNTILPDPANNRLLVYVLSYALRGGPTCGGPGEPGSPGNGQISIVEVPLNNPAAAFVLKTVPIPVSQTFDDLVFLGLGATDGCHDVQFFTELGIAAAACLSVGQLWDISDPANPVITQEFDNDDIEIWHSAFFTWDGETVIFGDESVFGSCQNPNQLNGRIWFYDTDDPGSGPLGSFLIPRLQPEYCSAHLFNVIPRRDGKNFLVSSWYGGGVSVIDFNDPANAFEIGYYDAQSPNSSVWSAYWYNGRIYANDIPRGFDVLNLSDSAASNHVRFSYLNPQVQESMIP